MKDIEIDYKKLYEEEHKKYEDALGRARGHHSVASHYNNADEIQELEHIFPELKEKESEDEKIRKELIQYLKDYPNLPTGKYCRNDFFTWLEKQGEQKTLCDKYSCQDITELGRCAVEHEQKSADKVEPKFKVGDWVVKGDTIAQILDIQEQYYVGLDINGKDFTSSRFLSDDKIHLWTINDAKDGDVLANKNGAIFINAGNTGEDRATLDCYCYLSVQGEFYIEEHKTGSWFYKTEIHPATKEQRDLLFSKMKEAGYEWDAEKKELKKIEQEQTELPKGEGLLRAIQILEQSLGEVDGWQSDDGILEHRCAIEAVRRLYEQKATWSKEDEVAWNNTMIMIKECAANHYAQDSINLVVTWLKSLKDRMTWRPTEEQMEALSDAVKLYKSTHFDSHHYKIETLYNDLKKL